jgi:hypothetical protein
MGFPSVNRFRTLRGRILRKQIETLAHFLGRDIIILDVGGRPDYWANVGVGQVARIDLLNHEADEMERALPADMPEGLFDRRIGDARDLSDYGDQSVDLVHSNSVIEHVGNWRDMHAMARELMRVGLSGWVQTPAWEFPIEPHLRAPFGHWFGKPAQTTMLWLSTRREIRSLTRPQRRELVESYNLLSKGEIRSLFPGRPILTERIILAKSYVVHWLPEGVET